MELQENRLPADESHEISCLICCFWKSGKIWNCRLLQIVDGALWKKSDAARPYLKSLCLLCCYSAVSEWVGTRRYRYSYYNTSPPGKLFKNFCRLLIFFKIKFFEKILSALPSECQTILIQIRLDVLSSLIWIQPICKIYKQTALIDIIIHFA